MDEVYEEAPQPALRERFGSALDRAEHIYLRLLRAAILVIATGLLLYAAWLGVWSLYKISQSPSSVKETPASVSADELTSADTPATVSPQTPQGPQVDPEQRRYYAGFVRRYHALFQTRFEPFRQKDDKQLSRDQFDDAFINSQGRLQSAAKGELNFGDDKADLEALLATMTDAAGKPQTHERLQRYKTAQKVRVSKHIDRTRIEVRSGWNSSSMSCPNWYLSPIGCSEARTVEVPYTETVTTMELPKGTESHSQIFRAFQDRFFALLHERRETNRAEAARKRDEISVGNLVGKLTLWNALKILGGFLVLMFFFLLIAIERHQRRMAREVRLA
jgi:hypothetical protein